MLDLVAVRGEVTRNTFRSLQREVQSGDTFETGQLPRRYYDTFLQPSISVSAYQLEVLGLNLLDNDVDINGKTVRR